MSRAWDRHDESWRAADSDGHEMGFSSGLPSPTDVEAGIRLKDFSSKYPEDEEGKYGITSRRLPRTYSRNKYVAFFQRLADGPEDPSDESPVITNRYLVPFERFPRHFNLQYPSRYKFILIASYVSIWFLLIYSILSPSFSSGVRMKNSDDLEIVSLSCTGGGYFWHGKNQECGLNGEKCTPFENRDVIIKCPALCDRGWTYSSTPVGTEMVKYRQYTIGGGSVKDSKDPDVLTNPYRGDSFPCSSAVHGGVLSPYFGGCVKLSFNGSQISFSANSGYYGTGMSVGFPSYFPSSFIFKSLPRGVSNCYDLRLVIATLNFLFGVPIMYLTSGLFGYWFSSIVGFWTVILSLDPPVIVDGNDAETAAQLVSVGFERLLPLCFVLYVLWETTVKRTLQDPSSPLFKTLVWYPLFWAGVMNNITFDRLPVDRLTPSDVKQQPGGLITIVGILVVLVVCIIVQGHSVWKAGRLRTYLNIYGFIIAGLIILALLPNLELRIHHYILGLVLIPGTSTRGPTAFILQGVLLGLVISGTARWDFASIVESHVSLMRGEAGSSTSPPANLTYANGVISWSPSDVDPVDDTSKSLHGYSLIINDIERYVGNDTSLYLQDILKQDIGLWNALGTSRDTPLFVRVAKSSTEEDSLSRGDYTMAGVLQWPSGEWVDPAEGVS